MITELKRTVHVRIYVPTGAEHTALQESILRLVGGYTVHPNAWGVWHDGEKDVREPCKLLEVLWPSASRAIAEVQALGQQFMQDNPQEKCFMAYVGGQMLTITRKEN